MRNLKGKTLRTGAVPVQVAIGQDQTDTAVLIDERCCEGDRYLLRTGVSYGRTIVPSDLLTCVQS